MRAPVVSVLVLLVAGCASSSPYAWQRPTEPADGVAFGDVAWRAVPVLEATPQQPSPYLVDPALRGAMLRHAPLPDGWTEAQLREAIAACVADPQAGPEQVADSIRVRRDTVDISGPAGRVAAIERFIRDRGRHTGTTHRLVARLLTVRAPQDALPRFTDLEVLPDGTAVTVLPEGTTWPERGAGETTRELRLALPDGTPIRFKDGEREPLRTRSYDAADSHQQTQPAGPLRGLSGVARAVLSGGPEPAATLVLDAATQVPFVRDAWVEATPPGPWEEDRPHSALLVSAPTEDGDVLQWLEPVRDTPTRSLPFFGVRSTSFAGRFTFRPGETLCLLRPTGQGEVQVLLVRWKSGRVHG